VSALTPQPTPSAPTPAAPPSLTLTVNGDQRTFEGVRTIADLVAAVIDGAEPRGIAVAVDRTVIPRSEWRRTPARPGSLVEVVTAAAGG
jgi:sulfur carrier protein